MEVSHRNVVSCDFNQYERWKTVIVLWAPVYSIPVFLTAVFLLKYHSELHGNYIRCAQLIAVFLNYLELVVMSTMCFPQFRVPVLGLQVGGVMENAYPRVIAYIIAALITHHGINTTTLFIAHLRLMVLSRSLILRKTSLNFIVAKSHQLSCVTYALMIVNVSSILLLFGVDKEEYQNEWKQELFEQYHEEFIWCPKFYVLKPTVWEYTVAMVVASTVTVLFAVVFVLCSLATIAIVQSAKDTMSTKSVRYHMYVVVSFLISCVIQAFFVVFPVVHFLLCTYSEFFKVHTGGFLFYSIFTQAHQGTAFTMFYVLFHRKTRKTFKKLFQKSQKTPINRIFKRSSPRSRSR